MRYWNDFKISEKQHDALILLYCFRGLTNNHLSKFLFGHLKSDIAGQKANVSRFISGLRKMKLIGSSSCEPYSKELIHFMSSRGIEYVRDHVHIDTNHPLAGFGDTFGDFNASLLKPTLKNLDHHMMFVNFAILAAGVKDLKVRHNLYSVREYKYFKSIGNNTSVERAGKVKPDGEILLTKEGSRFLIAMEIDTGSERFNALEEKFRHYKALFDYCFDNNLPIPYYAIFFVTKNQNRTLIKNDMRMQTIYKAAIAGLGSYIWKVQIYGFNKQPLLESLDFLEQIGISLPQR